MRGQDHVVQAPQRGLELVALRLGLDREDVDRRAGDVAALDAPAQRHVVDDHAARGVDEDRPRPHQRELLRAEQAGVARPPVHVQRHHVGLGQQRLERRHPAGVAVRQPVGGVEEDHPQAERLGDVGQLGADVAVADDAEGAAADLVAAGATCPTRPRASRAVFSGSRRASTMISAMIISATLRVLENGALNTGTPRSAAAARSTWLVPMQKQPTASRSGAPSSTRGVIVVFDRMPST